MTSSEQSSPAPRYRFFQPGADPVLPPRAAKTREVIGQCLCCHDHFTVTIFQHQGQLHVSEMASIRIEKSASGKQTIYHRRPTCQGEIKLFGNSL